MTDRVVVQFTGDGSDVAELSWGQQEIWGVMQEKDHSLPMGGAPGQRGCSRPGLASAHPRSC